MKDSTFSSSPNSHSLYWVPHLLHGWAVARQCSETRYILEYPIDAAANETDLILDLSEVSLRAIAQNFSNVSEVFRHSLSEKKFSHLITPISSTGDLTGVDNICSLSNVCEASVLHCIRQRYMKDQIYSNIGTILLSVNPFCYWEAMYDTKTMNYYSQADNPYSLSPHLFQVSASCYQRVCSTQKNQSILITGDSGSGKTECTKILLEYLAFSSSKKNANSLRMSYISHGSKHHSDKETNPPIEQRLLRANVLLEAFGNAKTSRNSNSSRFGKWIQIYFYSSQNKLFGASIKAYLLELPRITSHCVGEQAYHIFYQFLLALENEPALVSNHYDIIPGEEGIRTYPYLKPANLEDTSNFQIQTDNMVKFHDIQKAFADYSMDSAEQDSVLTIISAILHLGCIQFTESEDKESVTIAILSENHLQAVSRLLCIDVKNLRYFMENREIKTGRENIVKPLTRPDAIFARDGFAKLVYGCLFSWVVFKINKNLGGQELINYSDKNFIGILDVAGFESFAVNGLEQLCINYANEKLQHQFNHDVFQLELQTLEEEGLEQFNLTFRDNTPILETFESPEGIFNLLSEEMLLPRGSDLGFVSKFLQVSVKNSCVLKSKIHEKNKFTVKHFAGVVQYTVEGWLDKNKFAPPLLAAAALKTSTNPLIQTMFYVSPELSQSDKQMDRQSVTKLFKRDLDQLLETVSNTQTHYIRCIKPNMELSPRTVNAYELLRQLTCSGVMEAVSVRKSGFPCRLLHKDFISNYSIIYGRKFYQLTQMNNLVEACTLLIQHIHTTFGLPQDGMVIGRTRVLLSQEVQGSLDQYRKLSLVTPTLRIQTAYRGYRVRKYYKEYRALSHQLGPILGAGALALRQGGNFLYPACVIHDVTTPQQLNEFAQSFTTSLKRLSSLPPEFHTQLLTKARTLHEKMSREAEILMQIENLIMSETLHLGKLSTALEKTKQYGIHHPLQVKLEHIVFQLEYELNVSPDAEFLYQNEGDDARASQLLQEIQDHLEMNGFSQCLTKPMRRLVSRLTERMTRENNKKLHRSSTIETSSPELVYRESQYLSHRFLIENSIQKHESNRSQKLGGSYDFENSESEEKTSTPYSITSTFRDNSSYTTHTFDSTSSFGSDESNRRSEKTKDLSMAKLNKELKYAMMVLDLQRLDLLLSRYEESELSTSSPNNSYFLAKKLREHLDSPEWVVEEMKKASDALVWGKDEQVNFLRLTHLLERAQMLEVDPEEIQAAKKTLASLQSSSNHPNLSLLCSFKNQTSSIVPKYNFMDFPGLAIYKQKQKSVFQWINLFNNKSIAKQALCSHSFSTLDRPLLYFDKTSQKYTWALETFKYLQQYMGDRPNPTREDLADHIVRTGLAEPLLRDELYLQLMKQLTCNPNASSRTRGWALMLYFCSSFPPSSELAPYVRYFLFQHTIPSTEYTRGVLYESTEVAYQALKAVDCLLAKHIDSSLPSREDSATELSTWDTHVVVQMMDESRQKVEIHYDTLVGDVVLEICSRLHIDTTGWTIMILSYVESATLELIFPLLDLLNFDLLSQQIIHSTLHFIWQFPQFYIIPESERIWDIWDPESKSFPKLIFRRRMISVSELLYPHPAHAHLTYKQLLWEFRAYPIAEPMNLLASIIAHILVAERWSPPLTQYNEAQHSSHIQSLSQDNINQRSLYRTLCITYAMLESFRYIPTLYCSRHPTFQEEWVKGVQQVYATLDLDEHQLLAVNALLVQMRKLKAFGGLFWLVVEPESHIFHQLLLNSQLRTLYEGTSVVMTAGLLGLQLAPKSEPTTAKASCTNPILGKTNRNVCLSLQPMVLTPYDIERLAEKINEDAESKMGTKTTQNFSSNHLLTNLKRFFSFLKFKTTQQKLLDIYQQGQFAPGAETCQQVHRPLWMALNSKGLHFFPALSFEYTNWINAQTVFIPFSQLFSCETLWVYHAESKMWTYGGLTLCVDLRKSEEDESNWSLIVVVPLSCSVSCIRSALRAFVPSLVSYGETFDLNMDENDQEDVQVESDNSSKESKSTPPINSIE